VAHPLLATLGRDLRELQRSLPPTPQTDEYLRGTTPSDTLLGWLQSDIAANAVRPQGRTLAADDRSVQIHNCHGPARQVDVLREVLLGLLAEYGAFEILRFQTFTTEIFTEFNLGINPAAASALSLVDASIYEYQRRGFKHLMVAFGCTGGQHRSVYLAEQLAKRLRARNGVDVVLHHRELESRAE